MVVDACTSALRRQGQALNGIFPSNPSPQGSGNPAEEEAKEPEGMEDIKKPRPLKQHAQSSYELRLRQHAQGLGLLSIYYASK